MIVADVVNGLPLSGSGDIAAGWVNGGNALRFTSVGSITTPGYTLPATTSEPLYAPAVAPNANVTITGWAKIDLLSTRAFLTLRGYDTNNILQITFSVDFSTVILTANNNTTFQTITQPYSNLPAGEWFFFVAELVDGILGLQINNATPTHSVTPIFFSSVFPSGADSGGNFIISVGRIALETSDVSFDEVAVWAQGLTTIQKATLYNSGNGVTWPVDL